jgi:hypothetical protein
MEFEQASALHTRIEKLNPVLAQLPEIVHRIDRLGAVIVQPSASPNCVNLFGIQAAVISAPMSFPIQAGDHSKSQSMESRIQEALSSIPFEDGKTSLEVMEHLAILKRWFYRSNRVGEIFFAGSKGAFPFRRIVRGISRVFRGEKPDTSGITDSRELFTGN